MPGALVALEFVIIGHHFGKGMPLPRRSPATIWQRKASPQKLSVGLVATLAWLPPAQTARNLAPMESCVFRSCSVVGKVLAQIVYMSDLLHVSFAASSAERTTAGTHPCGLHSIRV